MRVTDAKTAIYSCLMSCNAHLDLLDIAKAIDKAVRSGEREITTRLKVVEYVNATLRYLFLCNYIYEYDHETNVLVVRWF